MIEDRMWAYGSISLSNIISAYAFFGTANEFFSKLLGAVSHRAHRLSSTSLQHVITALCRQQGRMDIETLVPPLEMACQHLTTPSVSSQVTPVQAVVSLSSLAKLQYRDLAATSVLLSVLVGRGRSVIRKWAPSVHFYSKRALPESPFNEDRCREVLETQLDSSYYVEILQSLQRLDLHSALTAYLTSALCGLLTPQLHELRAKELIGVARSLGACQAAVPPQPAAQQSWKERLVESCIENLRRHEHYLESSWRTLLPFKLLCLEIDHGTYGSRRLTEVLTPTLLSFTERLQSLTYAECEMNRLRLDRAGEDEESGRRAAHAEEEDSGEGAQAQQAADSAPTVWTGRRHRVVTGGHVLHIPTDVLVEAL